MSKLSIPRRRCSHCNTDAPYHLHWCPEVRPGAYAAERRAGRRAVWRVRCVKLIALAAAALLVYLNRGTS